jgi:hypothetical protein
MNSATQSFDWSNPSHEPLSNGPIRLVTGPAQAQFALDSDRWEMEYLLPFPFHALDPSPWVPLSISSNRIPITIYRPVGTLGRLPATGQTGNEEVDSYCTMIRLSCPNDVELSADEGWKIVRRLLEWVRIKCRHYWLLHGINGFGATYRGSLFTREENRITQQNLAMYGPNVIVNPLSREIWETLAKELEDGLEPPIEDGSIAIPCLASLQGTSRKPYSKPGSPSRSR